jgi:hypothetical protein
MSEFFLDACANDHLGPVPGLVRMLSGLTVEQAIDHLTFVDMALRGELDVPPGDARLEGMMALVAPWGEETGCDFLERAYDLILGGHHVNAHSGRIVWPAEAKDALAGRDGGST